jgi:predicted SprT family Zn-dependent metalloprotease
MDIIMSDIKRTKSGWIKVMRYDCDMCHKEDATIFEHDSEVRNWFGFCSTCYSKMKTQAQENNTSFSEYWDLDNWKI